MHEFHSSRSDQIFISCHPQFEAGCERHCFHSPAPNNSYPIPSQPFPFDPHCRPFPTTRISPAKQFIVCIRPELFCRPFPTVNSLYTDELYPDPIRTPFRYPLCHLCEKVYLCEAFLWIPKMPFKASISPFIATPLPSLAVTLCFHKGEHFPDDQALPQLCGLNSRYIKIYPPDTLPLLRRYIAKVHPSPQTNKPSLVILS